MKLKPKLLRNKKRAFALIELIMTVVVVGIAVLPLSITSAKNIQNVFLSHDITMATNLARLDLEMINNTANTTAQYDSIAATSYTSYGYLITRTVSYVNGISPYTESTKKIAVEVTQPGIPGILIRLVTYITRNITYPF